MSEIEFLQRQLQEAQQELRQFYQLFSDYEEPWVGGMRGYCEEGNS